MGYVARGLYRELLDDQWLNGFVPDNLSELAEIADCPEEVMRTEWPKIAPHFQQLTPGKLVNLKLEEMRTATDAYRVAQARFGKQGGRPKKTSESPNGFDKAEQREADGSEKASLLSPNGFDKAEQREADGSESPKRKSTEAEEEGDVSPPLDFTRDHEAEIPEGLAIVQYAGFVCERAHIPASYGLKVKIGDAIRMLSGLEGCSEAKATALMVPRLVQAQADGEKLNFWLEDGRWKTGAPARNGNHLPPNSGAQKTRERSDNEAREIWESMSDEYKKANPWTLSIRSGDRNIDKVLEGNCDFDTTSACDEFDQAPFWNDEPSSPQTSKPPLKSGEIVLPMRAAN